jgi:hypothetical protein
VETASRSPHLLSPRCERSSAGPPPACYGRRGGAQVEMCPPGQCAAVARAGAHVALAAIRAITHVDGKAIGSSRRRTPAARPQRARRGPSRGRSHSAESGARSAALCPRPSLGRRPDPRPASGEVQVLGGRPWRHLHADHAGAHRRPALRRGRRSLRARLGRRPAGGTPARSRLRRPDARNRSCLKPPVRCRAVRDGTPQRASGALGPHIVEVLLAIRDSATSGAAIAI